MSIISTKGATFEDARLTEFNAVTVDHIDADIPFKGASFTIELYSKVPSESQIVTNDLVETLDSAGTDQGLLQIFRASEETVNRIGLTLRGEQTTGTRVLVDNCNAETINWTESVAGDLDIAVEAVIVIAGNSLRFRPRTINFTGAYINRNFPVPVNWADKLNMEFNFYDTGSNVWRLIILDSLGNEAYFDYQVSTLNQWELFDIPFTSFENIAQVDLSDIANMRWVALSVPVANTLAYIDEIYVEGNIGDTIPVDVELYDFGTNATPANISEGTLMLLDNGATSNTRTLNYQRNVENFAIYMGLKDPLNTLTIGNYYGIYLKTPALGLVEAYGENTQTAYNSGNLYRVGAAGATSVSTGTLAFTVYAVVDALVKSIKIAGDGGLIGTYVYVSEVDENEKQNGLFLKHEFMNDDEKVIEIMFDNSEAERVEVDRFRHLHFYVQSSPDITANAIEASVKYHHNKIQVWG